MASKLNRFGFPVTMGSDGKEKSQLYYKRRAFAFYWEAVNAPPRHELFREIADEMVPGYFEWHEWTLRMVRAYCSRRWIAVTGCSDSAKTHNASGIACLSWLCAPYDTSVTVCSTTSKMLHKRIWSEVKAFRDKFDGDEPDEADRFGNMVDSMTTWQSERGDNKHCVFGRAVREGNVTDRAADIQGYHTVRQIVIFDEAEAVLAPAWLAMNNICRFPKELVFMALANSRSRLSQFGRFIEPINGYDSIGLESEEWEAKPFIAGEPPTLVLRFDFLKSPNIFPEDREKWRLEDEILDLEKQAHPDGGTAAHEAIQEKQARIGQIEKALKKVKRPSKFLPTAVSVRRKMVALKARNAENDPEHWCMDRGFPAPDGMANTVFSSKMFDKGDAWGQHKFTGDRFSIIGTFDPARGMGATGRPILRFAALGEIDGDRMGLEWMDPIPIYTDAKGEDTIAWQLAKQVLAHCQSVNYRGQTRKCEMKDLGVDTTGDGAAQADAIDQLLKESGSTQRVIRIQFQGACSKRPASKDDARPSNEVYKNKRAEMWYGTRQATEAGQIKGVDKDTAAELVEMRFLYSGLLILIEDKKDGYMKRVGQSPDYADTGIMLTEVAMQRGFVIAGDPQPVPQQSPFTSFHLKVQSLFTDAPYSRRHEREVDYAH